MALPVKDSSCRLRWGGAVVAAVGVAAQLPWCYSNQAPQLGASISYSTCLFSPHLLHAASPSGSSLNSLLARLRWHKPTQGDRN